ncbi:uncharacterized protein LOC103708311 [Phoenix dactylifera]|uniref:Uncharacterized protein LOC103708311 n=1 Tax=Phoenix dactylifera TaxID=42345 RepID=A0A8B7C456_PHODC|nr:uncharacterized protein LOC103708311 [Phoenix dactylifera]XP_008791399.2 uncharacterized protein LOC103708311 [Phoenix dactylifera]
MNSVQFQQAPMLANIQMSSFNASRALIHTHFFPKEYVGALQLVKDEESSKLNRLQLTIESSTEQYKTEKSSADRDEECQLHDIDNVIYEEADSASDYAKSASNICDKEIQRRWKIGLANKGRTPWNKGKKHSKETRELIKKRTMEALSDPKVRKKMSEYPHSHSDQSKARISSGLKKSWEKRLKHRRSQEYFCIIWSGSIAEAAREGGCGQQELNWDSYEKIKADIESQQIQQKAEKARTREIAKRRAGRVSQIRVENVAGLAKQSNGNEQKAEAKKVVASSWKRSEDEKKKMALSKGFKLKARLIKFHHRKKKLSSFVSIRSEKMVEPEPLVEKWDLEFIKAERLRRKISLADQIQSLKSRKAKCSTEEVPAPASFDSSVEEKAGG